MKDITRRRRIEKIDLAEEGVEEDCEKHKEKIFSVYANSIPV
jgi:hypothetical protein